MNKQKIHDVIKQSWTIIAPSWPIKKFVASNPLFSFESQHFEKALLNSYTALKQDVMPDGILQINFETIKWLEVFFDQGQATLTMPYRDQGLYQSVRQLLILDFQQRGIDSKKITFLSQLPEEADEALILLLQQLQVSEVDTVLFLQNILQTLPGWASYIVYYVDWLDQKQNPATKIDFLVVRLMIMYVIWPYAQDMLTLYTSHSKIAKDVQHIVAVMQENEEEYRIPLMKQLQLQADHVCRPFKDVQFIFCIDTRSERIRRHIEQQGSYETFGYAGFFGIPVQMHNTLTQRNANICPVLLPPVHKIREQIFCSSDYCISFQEKKISFKRMFNTLYKALKYTFVAPFALVEILGIHTLVWMILRQFAPSYASTLKNRFYRQDVVKKIMWPMVQDADLDYGLTLQQQCEYALQALRMIGLTNNVGKVLVITSHRALTENNAYQSALNCGACGGNDGLSNAKLLATILNNRDVRAYLVQQNIMIPKDTYVLAAEHITTTDEIILYDNHDFKRVDKALLQQIKQDLQQVQQQVLTERRTTLHAKHNQDLVVRSSDWSQVRPEWGLANNAAMIIGPRTWTQNIDLKGEVFLHSYDWSIDQDMSILRTIMTAPMIVAQWINMQYLFSAIDPVVYGGGSKATQNVTGKIGIMQGNMSDLMTGLPLQSVHESDEQGYHTLRRLTVIIYAPEDYVRSIIKTEKKIEQLVGNEWIHIINYDPKTQILSQMV